MKKQTKVIPVHKKGNKQLVYTKLLPFTPFPDLFKKFSKNSYDYLWFTIIFVIIEEAKENMLDFLQGTIKVL